MNLYIELGIATLLIVFLQFLIWKKTKEPLLIFPTLFLYYWSLLGGWFIVYDLLNNNSLANNGLHYYGYFDKLFPVSIDSDYHRAILYYSIFILSFQLINFWFLTSRKVRTHNVRISINHDYLIVISMGLLVLSYLFISKEILEAFRLGESPYLYISKHNGNYYSLFQLCKSLAIFLSYAGYSIFLVSTNGRLMLSKPVKFGGVKYVALFALVFLLSLIIGSRHDIVFAGIFCIAFLFMNSIVVRKKDVVILMLALAIPTFMIEFTRALPVFNMIHEKALSSEKPVQALNEGDSIAERASRGGFSVTRTMMSLVFSNEIFEGHMSMYGAIHYKLPLTYGSSFSNLAHSMIPRIISPNRPPDIYQHYITVARKPGLQGYSINHATGWYLNFGLAGVIMGGLLLGGLLVVLYNLYQSNFDHLPNYIKILLSIGIARYISFVPLIIRAGPEGYKSVIFECLLIPVFLLWICTFNGINPFSKKQN